MTEEQREAARAYKRQWYLEHKDHVRAYQKAYHSGRRSTRNKETTMEEDVKDTTIAVPGTNTKATFSELEAKLNAAEQKNIELTKVCQSYATRYNELQAVLQKATIDYNNRMQLIVNALKVCNDTARLVFTTKTQGEDNND